MTSPGSDAPGGHLPQFLDADAVGLRIAFAIELEASDQLLGQRAARAFGENDDLGLQVVARLEVRFLLAVLVDALVVGAHAADASGFEQQLRAGEAGEDRDAGLFHFAAQPLHELVDRDDVVAVIAHGRRRDGKLELAGARQEVDRFFGHGGVERRFFLEVGQQLAHGARIEQRAGEAVRAHIAGLFQQVNIFLAELVIGMAGVVLVDELRQTQRTGHAGRASADDDHVGFHHRTFNIRERFTKNNHQANSRRRKLELSCYNAYRRVCHIVRVGSAVTLRYAADGGKFLHLHEAEP